MFDFPNTPVTGDLATAPNGCQYRWDGSKWVALATPIAVAPFYNDSGRNLIHNGTFAIAQRGVGPFTTTSYSLDRWLSAVGGSTMSVTQAVLTDADRAAIGDEAARYCLQCVGTGTSGAGDYIIPGIQLIEYVHRLAGKTVTLSFWAKANSGTPKLGIDLYQSFGTGGSPSANVKCPAQAVTLSTTWTRYTTTWGLPSASGKTLGTNANDYTAIQLWMSSGTTNNIDAGGIGVQSYTLQLWGVQLEIGSAVTPLAKRDPADEWALCQRFYCVLYGVAMNAYNTATNILATPVAFPVSMRAAPTITLSGQASSNMGTAQADSVTTTGLNIYAAVTVTGNAQMRTNVLASADL